MRKNCLACQKEFVGRSDKLFCSTACKNQHNNEKRKNTRDTVRETDAYLHRNRDILSTLLPDGKKGIFDRLLIEKTGFHWDFCTGIYLNKEGKLYKLVYDYAWMDFSDQRVLVVRKTL